MMWNTCRSVKLSKVCVVIFALFLLSNLYSPKNTAFFGFDYAYRFPGMNKVLQAAGRVIRTAEDIGVVLLLDERFLQSTYRSLYPREWEQVQVVDKGNVAEKLAEFWKRL